MGKSIRSKKEKRLRSQRRELAQVNFYDKKDAEVQAKLAACLTEQLAEDQPAVQRMEAETSRGREGVPENDADAMAIDGAAKTRKSLKTTGGIRKKSSGVRVNKKSKKGRLSKKGKTKGQTKREKRGWV